MASTGLELDCRSLTGHIGAWLAMWSCSSDGGVLDPLLQGENGVSGQRGAGRPSGQKVRARRLCSSGTGSR